MKTTEQIQDAVDELLGVCRKHGIALNGFAFQDDYSFILICESEEARFGPMPNRVEPETIGGAKRWSVCGIGDVVPTKDYWAGNARSTPCTPSSE